MPHYAYGPEHRRKREVLMAVTPAGTLCPFHETDPKCPGPMYPGAEHLDLNHSDPAMKVAGLPGDQLSHRACNRRAHQQQKIAGAKAKRDRKADLDAARLPGAMPVWACRHSGVLPKEPRWPGCECGDPLAHHRELALAAKSSGGTYADHNAQCQGCGGYTGARIW